MLLTAVTPKNQQELPTYSWELHMVDCNSSKRKSDNPENSQGILSLYHSTTGTTKSCPVDKDKAQKFRSLRSSHKYIYDSTSLTSTNDHCTCDLIKKAWSRINRIVLPTPCIYQTRTRPTMIIISPQSSSISLDCTFSLHAGVWVYPTI